MNDTDAEFDNISPTEIEDISVAELDAALVAIKDAEVDHKAKKEIATEAYWVLEDAKANFMTIMRRAGKKKWSVAGHGGFSLHDELRFRVPDGPENKEKFFAFLKSDKACELLQSNPRDIFLAYASVNAQTMNSLCKKLKTLAADDGEQLELPGVIAPQAETKMRKTK